LSGYVATNMSGISKSWLLIPNPERFVKSALKTVEISDETSGYLPHAIHTFFFRLANYLAPTLFRKISYELYRNGEILQKYLNKN
jgi:hypothetical protein